MKKIFSWLLLYACMTATCHAQKITVPAAVTKAFSEKFHGAAEVKWGKENAKEYEAEFKFNNTDVSANFKTDGTWVETETTIAAADLPAAVSAAMNTKYPAAPIIKTEKLEKPGGIVQYEVVVKVNGKKKEVELNADGSFIN
jgi:uncharacterized membrane protein YkoI